MDDLAFLHAISDSPDDDAPRLVYADWLEEHGQVERAELIRVQIDLAHGRRGAARREKELLFQHREAWTAQLPEFDGIRWGDHERGFVESVWATTTDIFVENAATILSAAPVRRLIVKTLLLPNLREFAACPALARLTHLDISGQGTPVELVQFLELSPSLANLRSFRASDCGLTDADLRAMTAAFSHMSNLEELILSSNQIGSGGASSLATSRSLTKLVRLVLSHNQIGMEGARDLARASNFPKLRSLYLNSNPMDALGRRLLRQRFGARVCRF